MSKLCPHCKSKKVGSFNDTVMCCMACHQVFGKSQLIDATVFDQITASPEVLAPHLVFFSARDNGWCSMLTLGTYDTYKEAIAATVEKLKEVENG